MEDGLRKNIYLFTRSYKRRGSDGMRIGRAWTVTQGIVTMDHFELSCPGYELKAEGPVIIDKSKSKDEVAE